MTQPRHTTISQGRPYRFTYGVAAKPPCSFANALGKWDVQAGTCTTWHEAGSIPTEPLFIPKADAAGQAAEDDGVVLSYVVGGDGVPFLLMLDGVSFQELCRAPIPAAVPYQFHGQWLPLN